MIGELATAVQQIEEDPAILGLGDADVLRVFSSCGADQASILLADPVGAILYVVEVRLGPMDDRTVVRLVEHWAGVRKWHAGRRCFAVLVAEEIDPRYRNILGLISSAVPVQAMEMRTAGTTSLQFIPIRL